VTVTVYVPAASPVAVAAVPPDGDHEYVYPGVPPLGVTVAEPFVLPLHDTFVWALVVASGAGCVML
jgi:hypothetical protein